VNGSIFVVIASEAKQSKATSTEWIASSLTLLAMTALLRQRERTSAHLGGDLVIEGRGLPEVLGAQGDITDHRSLPAIFVIIPFCSRMPAGASWPYPV
jgi:hypothetical protein